MTRHRDLEAELHPSVRAARDLRATADLWPQLRAALQPGTTPQSGGKRTKRDASPMPINGHVSDVLAEIGSWANFWARVLQDETDWTPPLDGLLTTPRLLRELALHVGFFTERHDEWDTANHFVTECRDIKRKAEVTITPSGTRRIPLPLQCQVDGCGGTMHAPITPDAGYYPDLICDKNRHHRIEPLIWSRASWKPKAS